MFYKGSSPMLSVPKLHLNNVSLQSVITWQNNNQKPYWRGRPRAEMRGVAYSSSFMWSSARIQSLVKYPLTQLLASTLTQTHTARNLTAPLCPLCAGGKGLSLSVNQPITAAAAEGKLREERGRCTAWHLPTNMQGMETWVKHRDQPTPVCP